MPCVYVVLYSNPRGSTSYGEEFANLIDKDYPGHDYDDLISAVDAAVATGFVDPNNQFVTGGSRRSADRLDRRQDQPLLARRRPEAGDQLSELRPDHPTLPRDTSPAWRKERPWEDPMSYWKYSPLSLVGNAKTPTLVVVGGEDYRTPVSRSRAILYRASDARRADRIGEGARRRIIQPGPPGGGKGGAIIGLFDVTALLRRPEPQFVETFVLLDRHRQAGLIPPGAGT